MKDQKNDRPFPCVPTLKNANDWKLQNRTSALLLFQRHGINHNSSLTEARQRNLSCCWVELIKCSSEQDEISRGRFSVLDAINNWYTCKVMKYLCIIFPRGEGTFKVVFGFDSYKPQSMHTKLNSVQVMTDAKSKILVTKLKQLSWTACIICQSKFYLKICRLQTCNKNKFVKTKNIWRKWSYK